MVVVEVDWWSGRVVVVEVDWWSGGGGGGLGSGGVAEVIVTENAHR